MTDEEYDALDEMWTKTTPKINFSRLGVFARERIPLECLDDISAMYVQNRAEAKHKNGRPDHRRTGAGKNYCIGVNSVAWRNSGNRSSNFRHIRAEGMIPAREDVMKEIDSSLEDTTDVCISGYV